MQAGPENKLPYGSLPRLLLAWVCTEAVRTHRRELILGRSLSEFMRKLDLSPDSGGGRGERTRLRHQMKRLFRCTISMIYAGRAWGRQPEFADRRPDGVLVERTQAQ